MLDNRLKLEVEKLHFQETLILFRVILFQIFIPSDITKCKYLHSVNT